MCVYIFAGRFQPFHNGHMQVLQELCEKSTQRDKIVLAVVAPFVSKDIQDNEFLAASQEHHLPERNPWNVSVCLSAVTRVAKLFHRENILTTLLPRPEYGWDTICMWFPEKRIWVIPEAGETFDEKKADFFTKMGDTVLRLPDSTNVSGRILREYYRTDQYERFSEGVPSCVSEIYFQNKNEHNSEQDFQFRAKNYEIRSRYVKDNNINIVPVSFFQDHAHEVGNLLDLGSGTGYLSWFIKERLAVDSITLVDSSFNMLKEAQKKRWSSVITHNTSVETFCNLTTKRFDTILVRQLLHYVNDVDCVLCQIRKVLKDDGMVYIGQVVLKDRDSQAWHDELMKEISENRRRSFVYSELLDLLSNHGFTIIDSKIVDYEDDIFDLVNRRIGNYNPSTVNELASKMDFFATPSVREAIKYQKSGHNSRYTVQFCHLLLKSSV